MSVIGIDVKNADEGFVVHRKRLVQSVRRPNDPCRLLHLNLNIIYSMFEESKMGNDKEGRLCFSEAQEQCLQADSMEDLGELMHGKNSDQNAAESP